MKISTTFTTFIMAISSTLAAPPTKADSRGGPTKVIRPKNKGIEINYGVSICDLPCIWSKNK